MATRTKIIAIVASLGAASLASIRDPYDRFIIAAARAFNARLITRDRAIRSSGLVATIWD